MPSIIEFEGLQLGIQADHVELVPGGYRLDGTQVALLHPFGSTRYYRHGFHSWSLSAWVDMARQLPLPEPKFIWPQVDDPRLFAAYPFSGSGVGALQDPGTEKVLLLGALNLDARVQADAHCLSGMGDDPQSQWFVDYGSEAEVFSRYSEQLEKRLGKRPGKATPRVWCS